jgi:hypothetical protein
MDLRRNSSHKKPTDRYPWAFAALLISLSCHHAKPPAPTTQLVVAPGLTPPFPRQDLVAMVTPPLGWRPDPLKSSGSHTHQTWISPSGHTAFGVIHFTLPIPLSANFVLPFYMNAWKKDQGESKLLLKESDPALPGIRFVAEGGLYRTWSNLIVDGRDGWSIYVGVLRAYDPDPAEMTLAEEARESTRVGLPE